MSDLRSISGSHPWERDNPLTELHERLAAFKRFEERGGKRDSVNGRRRLTEIQQLQKRVEAGK